MRVVLLAGGLGTRLAEESGVKPIPMVEIGGHPFLWHIMQGYASQGFKEFMVALRHKGEVTKEYSLNDHGFRNDCLCSSVAAWWYSLAYLFQSSMKT